LPLGFEPFVFDSIAVVSRLGRFADGRRFGARRAYLLAYIAEAETGIQYLRQRCARSRRSVTLQLRIAFEPPFGQFASGLYHSPIADKMCELERQCARLPGTEKIAWTAQA
jgi:hypothetical protein